MLCRPTPSFRGALSGLILLLAAQLLFALQPADANPLPEGVLLVHIQAENPDFCAQPTIATCEEIVQYTTASGPLEFDIFIYPMAHLPPAPGEAGLQSFSGQVTWPADWTLISASICNDGIGLLDQVGPNQLDISAAWAECPGMNSEEPVLLVASVVLDVTSEGDLHVQHTGGLLCDAGTGTPFWLDDGYGRAGVECGFCYRQCDLGWPCRAFHDTGILELEVEQGQTVSHSISAALGIDCGAYPNVVVESTAPWLVAEMEWLGPVDYVIELTADPAGLATGYHQAWVRSIAECTTCTSVILQVLPGAQGIPEDPEPAKRDHSWGRIKALYR